MLTCAAPWAFCFLSASLWMIQLALRSAPVSWLALALCRAWRLARAVRRPKTLPACFPGMKPLYPGTAAPARGPCPKAFWKAEVALHSGGAKEAERPAEELSWPWPMLQSHSSVEAPAVDAPHEDVR